MKDKKKPTRPNRNGKLTTEEIAEIVANTKRFEAEARQADAEAALAVAQAEEAKQAARRTSLMAQAEEFALKERKISHEAGLSSDVHYQVYRFLDPVDEETVCDCMQHLTLWDRTKPTCDIEIVFTSPGGDVVSGLALFDYIQMLKRKGHKITTKTYGMAASMAGILLQAGTERVSGKEAWVLIHEGSFGARGDVGKVEDMVNWVKRIGERIVDIFATRAAECLAKRDKGKAKGPKEIAKFIRQNWNRKDWWLSSDEMLKHGFIDRIE